MNATRPPPSPQVPPDVVDAGDYARHARDRLDATLWAWLDGGSGTEITRRDNEAAFERIRLCSRVLADVAGGDTRLRLFGVEHPHPIFLAPVAFHRLLHPDGELATVLGASALQAGMVVSTQASCTIEDIAAAAQTPLWFQLYLQPDRSFTLELVRRAEAAGYCALVVTVDAPVVIARPREQRAGFTLPAGMDAVNLSGISSAAPPPSLRPGGPGLLASTMLAQAPRWPDLAWLVERTRLPVLVKGIVDPGDAMRAIEYGAAGIVVSNHGGRTLDGVPAAIDALPRIVEAVEGRVPLLLDGGIRRGSDVLKAIALGARAVMIGRPYMHALATAGAVGVAHLLHLLRIELEFAMALTGCRDLAAIDRSALWL